MCVSAFHPVTDNAHLVEEDVFSGTYLLFNFSESIPPTSNHLVVVFVAMIMSQSLQLMVNFAVISKSVSIQRKIIVTLSFLQF